MFPAVISTSLAPFLSVNAETIDISRGFLSARPFYDPKLTAEVDTLQLSCNFKPPPTPIKCLQRCFCSMLDAVGTNDARAHSKCGVRKDTRWKGLKIPGIVNSQSKGFGA